MSLVVPDLDPLVSYIGRISAYILPFMPFYLEIMVISQDERDSEAVITELRKRVDTRYTWNPTSFLKVRWSDIHTLSYTPRALVVLTEKLSLGTRTIEALAESLTSPCIACNCKDWQPTERDLIVDIDANRFYKK